MTIPNESIMRKVRQLFLLAEKTNHPHEAAAAIGKAQALMTQHSISTAMLESSSEEEKTQVFDTPLNANDRKLATWKRVLARVLTKANGCCYCFQGPFIKIVGKTSNVDKVRYLFAYCERRIDRLTKENCRGAGKTYALNFRIGCVHAIDDAIKTETKAVIDSMKQTAKSDLSITALVVLNKALIKVGQEGETAIATMNKAFGWDEKPSKPKAWSNFRGDDSARAHGYQAGQNIYPGTRTALTGAQKKLN